MSTFLELQNEVAYYLDDLQFGYFTPTQVKLWINNAQKEVQKRLINAGANYYVKCVQTQLVVGQREYALPLDFKKEHRLELVMSGVSPNETTQPLGPITINQQDLIPTLSGTPMGYYFRRASLIIRPAPDTALTMRMEYSYQVADMVNDTDIPDVPADYSELIALLAAEDGFIKDGRASDLLEKKIAEYNARLKSDAQERNQDQSRMVVDSGQSYDGGFFF